MTEYFTAIGHVALDTGNPDRLGGGVSYSGIAARNLDARVTILTRAPETHPYLCTLRQRGITIIVPPSDSNTSDQNRITTFSNEYDRHGNRQQVLLERQDPITTRDLIHLPTLRQRPTFLVAPIIGEVETAVIPKLAKKGEVAVTPQGYFRKTGENGVIYQKDWSGYEKHLAFAKYVILSDEDIAVEGVRNDALLSTLRGIVPTVILTRGELGATVYSQEEGELPIAAFELYSNEILDPTGAGDVFAAAFLITMKRTGNLHNAAVAAALYAAIKLTTPGIGIEAVPSSDLVDQFVLEHRNRVNSFCTQNGLGQPPLL